MKIKPLGTQILVEWEVEEKTKSGIIIPDVVKEGRPEKGKVVEVGKDVKDIKKDDMILFSRYTPNELELEDKRYLVVKEEDVLAILS